MIARDQLLHKGSLVTFIDQDQRERCLGDLLVAEGRGVLEPSLGPVDLTPDEAEAHNRELSKALIKGLDERCKVGQCGSFYATKRGNKWRVITWSGDLVSDDVRTKRKGKMKDLEITFNRNGKTFRGIKPPDCECVEFERIS